MIVPSIHPGCRQRPQRRGVQVFDRQGGSDGGLKVLIFVKIARGQEIAGDPVVRHHGDRFALSQFTVASETTGELRCGNLCHVPSVELRTIFAKRALAKSLVSFALEHLDPTGEDWDTIGVLDKDFHRECVARLLQEPLFIAAALAYRDDIGGSS